MKEEQRMGVFKNTYIHIFIHIYTFHFTNPKPVDMVEYEY